MWRKSVFVSEVDIPRYQVVRLFVGQAHVVQSLTGKIRILYSKGVSL